jgi:ABC-type glycerol-3-phosphate transport system permease component
MPYCHQGMSLIIFCIIQTWNSEQVILIFLSTKIDSIIKAELPKDNTVLRSKIRKFMTHAQNHLTRTKTAAVARVTSASMAFLILLLLQPG